MNINPRSWGLFLSCLCLTFGIISQNFSSYEGYKGKLKREWKLKGITGRPQQDAKLIRILADNLYHPSRERSTSVSASKDFLSTRQQEKVLFTYNFLRESHAQPLAHSFSAMDLTWIKGREAETIRELYNLETATEAEKELVKKAQDYAGFTGPLIIFKNKIKFDAQAGVTSFGEPWIALCGTKDLNYTLFIVYHELAHLVHDDTALKSELTNGVTSSREMLARPLFKNHLRDLNRFVNLGKKAFDTTTAVGITVNDVLKEHSSFWIEPLNKDTYNEMLVLRATEQRADLFACQMLYKQNNLDPLLRVISLYAKQTGYWSVQSIGDEYPHPSAFERALYIAGFLSDKGVNLNEAFKKFLKHS